jgi:hypothetical protein
MASAIKMECLVAVPYRRTITTLRKNKISILTSPYGKLLIVWQSFIGRFATEAPSNIVEVYGSSSIQFCLV